MSTEAFRFNPAIEDAAYDIRGLSVVCRDGDVGSVDQVVETGSGFIVVVSTGVFGFGKGRMVPAGLITEVDQDAQLIRVDASSEQIKEAPKFDEDVADTPLLESQLLDHYEEVAEAGEPHEDVAEAAEPLEERTESVPQESPPLVAAPFASTEPEPPPSPPDRPTPADTEAPDVPITETSVDRAPTGDDTASAPEPATPSAIESTEDAATAEAPTAPETTPAEAPETRRRKPPSRARSRTSAKRDGRRSVPIARYDALSVDEILPKLRTLSQTELTQVDRYERAHGSRKTVLERIEALRGDQPWRGYDNQNVADVKKKLAKAQPESARFVRDYERKHKARSGVVEAAQRRLQEV